MIIDKSWIINKEDFAVIEDLVTCSICKCVSYNPIICNVCENCFCNACINTSEVDPKTCPWKCEKSNFIESRAHRDLLKILKFHCANKCPVAIAYDSWKDHYDFECEKMDNPNEKLKTLSKTLVKIEEDNKELKTVLKWKKNIIFPEAFRSVKHVHLLWKWKIKIRDGWECDECRKYDYINTISYYCSECDYDWCVECKTKEEKYWNK